jgi:hypothetical protein
LCLRAGSLSVKQDEEQALACQPLPVTPETPTSLS